MESNDIIGKSILMASLSLANTWYFFRENGEEIKVELMGDKMKSHYRLSQYEKRLLNGHRKRKALREETLK